MDKNTFVENIKAEQAKELADKIAMFDREESIKNKLEDIINEESSEINKITINTLLPFITTHIKLADESLVSELIKQAQPKKSSSKISNENLGRTYLILDGKRLKSEKSGIYDSLITKTGVIIFEENKDYLVVVRKNYGRIFTQLVKDNGFNEVVESNIKVSATAVALREFTLKLKEVKDKNVDTLEVVKTKSLSYFDEPEA